MRIGVYFPGYLPESGGGYAFERDLLQTLLEISGECSHEFVIIHEKTGMQSFLRSNNKNLRVKAIPKPKLKPYPIRLIGKIIHKMGLKMQALDETGHSLSNAIAQEKIEFLWFLTPVYFPVNIPYIATIWDIQHRVQPWFPEVGELSEWKLTEKYISDYLQRATYVITPNMVGRDEIAFYYQIPPERFIVLPHPTPKISLLGSEQVDKILEKYQLVRHGYLLYPAQFWPHKNHINLLEAIKILRDEYKINFPLVLVGSDKGNLQFVLERAKEIGVDGLLHFLGFIPEEDLIGLYQGAFALIFTSLFGPENLPPLEAFYCGCPVIVNQVAGSIDQLQDAALQVDGTKPSEIAGAINSIYLNTDLYEKLVTIGHLRAEAFTPKDYVRGVFSALNKFEPVRQTWGIEYDQNK